MPVYKDQKITEIISSDNKTYKLFLKLLTSKGLKKENKALFSGQKTVPELLRNYPEQVKYVLINNKEQLYNLPPISNNKILIVEKNLFKNLDIFGTKSPILITKTINFPKWDEKLSTGLNLFLPFQDPNNLGAALRTAAALGATVILLNKAANPFHPKSLRASGPAVYKVQIQQGPNLEDLVNFVNLPIYALALKGENIYKTKLPATLGLLSGPEGEGLEDLWPPQNRLHIPMAKGSQSLNANVSLAIAAAIYNLKMNI